MSCTRIYFVSKLALAVCLVATASEALPRPNTLPSALSGFEWAADQTSGAVLFLAQTPSFAIAINRDGSAQYGTSGVTGKPRLEWVDARAEPEFVADHRLPTTRNYYFGDDPAKWRLGVGLFQTIRFRGIYRGIDLLYRIEHGALEYSFVLQPGADPRNIRMRVPEGWRASLTGGGDLELDRAGETLRLRKLSAFQMIGSRRNPVQIAFQLRDGIAGVLVGPYRAELPLVIDPSVSFSAYLGGTGWDAVYGIAADSAGNVYVTGETSSPNFPGAPYSARSTRAAFVTKLKNGVIQYTTILSSSGNDAGNAIAVDTAGYAYVAGKAGAANFPVTSGAAQTTFGGAQDAFVVRLDPAGRIVYSTFLGGSGSDVGTGIAVDSSGDAYVSGYTASANFPTTSGVPQQKFQGGYQDAFLAKLNPAGSQFLYATLLGGQGNDTATAVAVDGSGNAVIAGYTDSGTFPVSNAFQPQYGGGGDGFVASLNPSGTHWNFVTYLGGSGMDQANAVAVDAAGNVYVTGATNSSNFPTSATAYQQSSHGGYDAFVVKLNSCGGLLYSTLFGGSGTDSGNAIVVDAAGQAWIAGQTMSFDLATSSPVQASNHGSFDGFIAQLNSTGSTLLFGTYWGGSMDDRIYGLALSGRSLWAAGYTSSADFPTVANGSLPGPNGGYDAFVTQLQVPGLPPSLVSVSPTSGSGIQQTFAFQVSDPAGYGNIGLMLMLVGPSLAPTNTCYLYFTPANNSIGLASDQGNSMTPVVLGFNTTTENSQCRVNAAASSASGAGNVLTLNVALTFKAKLTGQNGVYLWAQNNQGLSTGFPQMGSWAVPVPGPPQLVSVSPASGSGMQQTFAFQAADPGGYGNINQMLMLVGPFLAPTNTCYVYYTPANNSVGLASDQGAWTQVVLGSNTTTENSQCRLNAVASSATGTGSVLTVSVSLTFKTKFAGPNGTYLWAQNSQGQTVGWKQMGSWTVPAN